MHSAWLRSAFRRVLKFLQIKESGPNFLPEPILQKVWITWSPLLDFNFKSLMYTISLPFIRFQCILHDEGVLFAESWNFYKFKSVDLISGWNQFSRKSELFGPPFCILILKVFSSQIHRHWLDFNAFCMIKDYFLRVLKFLEIKVGGPNFWGNRFCRMTELFGPVYSISILKVWWTQSLRHWLGFNAFCMIKECFSQSLEISAN